MPTQFFCDTAIGKTFCQMKKKILLLNFLQVSNRKGIFNFIWPNAANIPG